MTNRAVRVAAVIICLLVLLPALLSACRNPAYLYNERGAIECGGGGRPIVLVRNVDAADPTFAELMAFLAADTTDRNTYLDDAYVCADFARDVFNHAQAAGIRAGWVGIEFENAEVGHAVNVFETTDRGTVYIDCTNGADADPENAGRGWDMIAYLEIGRSYGVIPVAQVIATGMDFYPLTYDYYAEREAAWLAYAGELDTYNQAVKDFNAATSGRTFIIGSAEYRKVNAWQDDLRRREMTIEDYRASYGTDWYESEYSSYTVKDIAVHW